MVSMPFKGNTTFQIILALFFMFITGCSEAVKLQQFEGFSMGTLYHVKIMGTAEQKLKLEKKMQQMLQAFEIDLSNWNEQSFVSRFNKARAREKMICPPHVAKVLKSSGDLWEKSSGAFDITISPILELWGFGFREEKKVPPKEKIARCLAGVGFEKLIFDEKSSELEKTTHVTSINPSAIAKGYAVDLVAEVIEEEFNLHDYMVEIGGEIRVSGHAPGKSSWTLGVKTPSRTGGVKDLKKIIHLKAGSLATSGDYENFFLMNGKRYQHIFDPRTGWPVEHELASVSITGPECMISDGLATACLVLGVEKGLQLLQSYPGYEGYFIERQPNGTFRESESPGFSRFVSN